MSGSKRAMVSISQDEYDRLRDSEGRLRALPEPAPDTSQVIQQQSFDLLKSSLQEVQGRQVRFLDFLSQVDVAVQDMERNTTNRLVEIERQAFSELENQVGCLRSDLAGVLAEQQRRYEEMTLGLHRQQQAELAAYAADLDRVYQDYEQRQVIATRWFENYANFYAFLRENYALDFFFPGSCEQYESNLLQVESNLAGGFFDAVLLSSQQAFQNLSTLRLELESRHAEWNILYMAAWEAISQEISLVENSFFVPAYDLDGNELSYLVDVNFWDPGKLDLLHSTLSELGSQLVNQDQLPAIAELRSWLSNTIPELHQQLENTIIDARIHTINSQLRINVADLVVQALQEQGFTLSACAYNEYDLRQGYGARLTNLDGSEVIVQVTPAGDAVGENELQIRSLDSEERTEHELQRRWQEINQSLQMYGVDVGAYERLDIPQRHQPRRSPLRVSHSALPLSQKAR
jgi:hypothetical protein